MQGLSIGLPKRRRLKKAIPQLDVLSNLYTWYRSEEGITSVAGKVSVWADSGPNGFNAVQATDSRRPRIDTEKLNGLPVVTFTGADTGGTNRVVSSGMNLSLEASTHYLVAKINQDIVGSNSYDVLIDGQLFTFELANDGAANTIRSRPMGSGLNPYAIDRPDPGSWFILQVLFNGSTERLMMFGDRPSTYNANPPIVNNVGNVTNWTIGCRGDGFYGASWACAEFISYATVHNATTRDAVFAYLRKKWKL